MSRLTRRGFLSQTSAGVATLGALLAVPGLTDAAPEAPHTPSFQLTREELAGPIMVHVRNLTTGEVALLVGTREIVFHDRPFVSRLTETVKRSSTPS